jgi:hypothetical protein
MQVRILLPRNHTTDMFWFKKNIRGPYILNATPRPLWRSTSVRKGDIQSNWPANEEDHN